LDVFVHVGADVTGSGNLNVVTKKYNGQTTIVHQHYYNSGIKQLCGIWNKEWNTGF
jgi:hypothetical protein